MNAQLANTLLAKDTLDGLLALGMREICICPGSRNAPWIQLLAQPSARTSDLRAYWFFEERSASFFALGRIRASGRPVGVVTTSGTAVAELLPATMEAYYSGLPLVLVTADRPRRFRGTGAPQSAEQVGLFGKYCTDCIDVAGDEKPAFSRFPKTLAGPLHLNACFEEPTQTESHGAPSAAPAPKNFSDFQARSRNPLVVVGSLSPEERPAVRDFLLQLEAPVYFEGLSGLRERPELERLRVHVADRIFTRAEKNAYPIDGVLRIGGIPTHRLWRDLEDRFTEIPVFTVSHLPFPGLSRPVAVASGDIASVLREISPAPRPRELQAAVFHEADRITKKALTDLLQAFPSSEPGLVHQLSRILPDRTRLFLGNSLPVREWDLAADWANRGLEVTATRGVNGIDGQVSTFLGLCDPERPNWALLGDLTALYDLAGPWILRQLAETRVTLVVINNGGGKIFDRMYREREFQNLHELRLNGWAELWDLEYVTAREIDSNWRIPADKSRLIELIPDAEATQKFWKEYQSL